MENNKEDNKCHSFWCCGCNTKSGSLGWGIFFLIIGGYFIAEELGYISYSISFWSLLIAAFGLYLIVRSIR